MTSFATSSDTLPPTATPASFDVHVVSHTHWDREWYHAASRFRQRLVPLVDALLARDAAPATPFLLDGQAIVLADYLAVRPEQADRLREQLRVGALEAGPWYVLADNLIPSGEAILRNLQAGARHLARLGATPPAVAYCPDTFGHPAMLPAIAAGYGMPVAVVWRGLGGLTHPRTETLWWTAPDGSRVLAYHLPPDGYEVGSALPVDSSAAAERWQRLLAQWRTREDSYGHTRDDGMPGTRVTLLPNGADHHALQPDIAAAIATLAARAALDGARLQASSLSRFATRLREAAGGTVVAQVSGELRDSYGYTWTLQGTLGTRAAQKRCNAQLERALLRDVEPWLALAWLHGGVDASRVAEDARLTLAQLPALLNQAWETLLRTHPHDTLCGCSTDDVAAAMETRQRAVRAQLPELRRAALSIAMAHDAVSARSAPPLTQPPVLVRNRAARARGGIAELRIVETIGDVRVGPGSALHPPPLAARIGAAPAIGALAVQSGRVALAHDRRESPQHYPDDDLVRVHHVVAWVPEIPALGVRVLDDGATVTRPPTAVTLLEQDGGLTLTNDIVRVECRRDGVTLRAGDRAIEQLLSFESMTDAGDSYTPSPRGRPIELTLQRLEPGARGPLRASVRLQWLLPRDRRAADAPVGHEDAVRTDVASMTSDTPVRRARHGAVRGAVRVDVELTLDAGADHLRIDVRGDNRRRDHRLRMRLRTGLSAAADVSEQDSSEQTMVYADAAFGPVRRVPIIATADAQRVEAVAPGMPLHRWLAVSSGRASTTLISDGLAEAEVADDHLYVTLLRAIGELSRADLPERPGHAGWPCATPHAQSLGRFSARFGVRLDDAWSDAVLHRVEETSETLLLPLLGETWRDYRGSAATCAGPALHGAGLVASAVSLSADGRALLLRASNLTASAVLGAWQLPGDGPWMVTPCRLDETPLGPPALHASAIPLRALPRALVTLRVERASG